MMRLFRRRRDTPPETPIPVNGPAAVHSPPMALRRGGLILLALEAGDPPDAWVFAKFLEYYDGQITTVRKDWIANSSMPAGGGFVEQTTVSNLDLLRGAETVAQLEAIRDRLALSTSLARADMRFHAEQLDRARSRYAAIIDSHVAALWRVGGGA